MPAVCAPEPGSVSLLPQKLDLDSRFCGHPRLRPAILEGLKNRDRDKLTFPKLPSGISRPRQREDSIRAQASSGRDRVQERPSPGKTVLTWCWPPSRSPNGLVSQGNSLSGSISPSSKISKPIWLPRPLPLTKFHCGCFGVSP